MHKCETSQLKDKRGKWVKNPKSNEMLVTMKLRNRKYRQVIIIIKSKRKFKDTSENAKRKKAAATFQYQRKKNQFQGLKHTG